MKAFLKENFVIVIGISLPLVLMAVFFLAGQSAKTLVDDPQYDALFVTNYNAHWEGQPWEIEVENGRLEISYEPDEDDQHHYGKPQIYIVDHETQRVELLDIDFDDIKEGKQVAALDALNKKKLLEQAESPDGYRFEPYYRGGHGGIMGDLFGFGRSRYTYALVKEPRTIPVKGPQRMYGATFLAWIDEEPS